MSDDMKECCSSPDATTPSLVLIDIQEGFRESYWGTRNNPLFEANVRKLIEAWRRKRWPVIHIQHLSNEPESPLRPGHDGARFMSFAEPYPSEPIFTKHVNSAFIGTELEAHLKQSHVHRLVIVGLTTDHCVSTTSRMAANLGFQVTIATDATATFERKGPDDEVFSADLVHKVALASLNKEFAELKTTLQLLASLI
jgi:nicotinamidase-related amidase